MSISSPFSASLPTALGHSDVLVFPLRQEGTVVNTRKRSLMATR